MSEASIVESIRNIMRGLVRLALKLLLHLSTATCFGPMLPTAAHQPATQAIEPPVRWRRKSSVLTASSRAFITRPEQWISIRQAAPSPASGSFARCGAAGQGLWCKC